MQRAVRPADLPAAQEPGPYRCATLIAGQHPYYILTSTGYRELYRPRPYETEAEVVVIVADRWAELEARSMRRHLRVVAGTMPAVGRRSPASAVPSPRRLRLEPRRSPRP